MRTPIKQRSQGMTESKQKSSLKNSNKHPRVQQQFNPLLYVSSTLSVKDALDIKEAFDHYDLNRTGVLTPNDLKLALFDHNFHANRQTLFSILAEYDEQGLGVLTFETFMQIISSDPTELQNRDALKKIFKKYDRNNKGYMDFKDLEHVAKSLNENMTTDELTTMFNCLDKQKTGKIMFQDFAMIVHHPSCFK